MIPPPPSLFHTQYLREDPLWLCAAPPFFSLFSFSAFLLAVFLFSGGGVLWLRQCELMENVKPACRGALALTRADCGVTPAVLP